MLELYIPRYRDQKEPFELNLVTSVKAAYKVQICRNGHVVREPFGPKFIPNLITNFGLDRWMQGGDFCASLFNGQARIGSGTTPPANTDVALVTQLKNTSTHTGSGGSSVNDTVNGAVTHTQSFEFSAEVGTVTYNEVGLSDTATGNNIWTRALFPSTVVLNSGDNMRVVYAMTFSIPATVTPITVSLSAINGFNISGQMKMCGQFSGGSAPIFGNVAANGSISGGQDTTPRCSLTGSCYLCSVPTTFPSVNANLSMTQLGTVVTSTLGTYTAGTFTRTAQAIWVPSNPSTTVSNVNGIYIVSTSTATGLYLLLTSAQTKANTNTLTVNWSSTIARV